jgi:hypothetical protein
MKSELKVVKGEFGVRESGKITMIQPLADPPKQYDAIGKPPVRVLRNPSEIGIDPDFQRTISNRGKTLIHDMVREWHWPSFIPPAIYRDERYGQEVAYDGQHTLIGAATRNDIITLPCDLHESLEDAVAAAAAFLERNTHRIGVSPFQRFKAALKADHPWATELRAMSKQIGFHIPLYPSVQVAPDTVLAITTMRNLMERRSARDLEKIMKVLVGNGIAPIREMHIQAVETMLFEPEFKGAVTADRLRQVLRGLQNNLMVADASTEAMKRGMTRHQSLANIYYREYQGVHGVR